jgi:hypothetical protein
MLTVCAACQDAAQEPPSPIQIGQRCSQLSESEQAALFFEFLRWKATFAG